MAKLALTSARSRIIDAALIEWREMGLSVAPADFPAAEKAIKTLYAHIGLKPPHFVRLSSPLGAELYLNFLTKTWPTRTNRDQLRGQLEGQLADPLWAQLRNQLRRQLEDQLSDQLADPLWGQLRNQLWGHLGDQLSDQLGGQLGRQLRGQLEGQLRGQLWGQQLSHMGTWFWGAWDHYWMWLDGGRRVGALYEPRLDALLDSHVAVCRSVGHWYPFDDFCILTDRAASITLDDRGRLHNTERPALSYRDGYSLWMLHGLPVPRQIIEEPETLTFSQVRDEPNAEIRRHMLDRFGGLRGSEAIAAWLKAGNLAPIDREDITDKMQPSGLSIWRLSHGDNPVTCNLYRAELEDDEPLHILTVVCTSTAKAVPLRVPPTIRKASEARAWTFGRKSLVETVET